MRLGADDWAIVVSQAFSIAFIVDVVLQTRYGLGKHIYDLPATTNFTESLKLFYYGEAVYYIVVGTTKVAILFLYLRLIPQKGYRLIIWATMVFVTLTFLVFVIVGLFQCSPINFAWDKTIVGGTCFNVTALFYANAGVNIFQDLLIYVLPMRMLFQIQLPQRQKIALIIVFAIGGFVCVTGMLRLNSLKTASISKDPTWDNFDSAIWSAIESNVGIVCASLVHYKPLIAHYFPSWMGIGSTHRSKTPLGSSRSGADRSNFVELHGGTNADMDSKGYHVAVIGRSGTDDNSSEEHLRGGGKKEGIYKGTSISVSRV